MSEPESVLSDWTRPRVLTVGSAIVKQKERLQDIRLCGATTAWGRSTLVAKMAERRGNTLPESAGVCVRKHFSEISVCYTQDPAFKILHPDLSAVTYNNVHSSSRSLCFSRSFALNSSGKNK